MNRYLLMRLKYAFARIIFLWAFTLAVYSSTAQTISYKNTHLKPGEKIDRLEFISGFAFQCGQLRFHSEPALRLGGISGIDIDADNELFYMVSDDKKYNRSNQNVFIKAKLNISNNKITGINIVDVHHLKVDSINNLESIRLVKNKLYFSTDTIGHSPLVFSTDTLGKEIKKRFKVKGLETGFGKNEGIESLSFVHGDSTTFWVENEKPFKGACNTCIKLVKTNNKGDSLRCVLINLPELLPNRIGSISEILTISETEFLLLYKDYYEKKTYPKLLCIVIPDSDGLTPLTPKKEIVLKEGFINHSVRERDKFFDNLEGMCFGHRIDGSPTLLFVSDDNFCKSDPPPQETQFLWYKIITK